MFADRFLTWVYFTYGLSAEEAQRVMSFEKRSEMLTGWIRSGCPYAVGY